MSGSTPNPILQTLPVPASGPVDPSLYETVARLAMPTPSGTRTALTGMAWKATSPSAHTITIDTGPGGGGADTGPEPLELVLLAIGACVGMDVIAILRKKRQTVTAYTINVYANQAKEHPKVYTEIMVEHLFTGSDLDPRAVARSIELSITKYCPVNAMLRSSVKIENVYRIVDEQ